MKLSLFRKVFKYPIETGQLIVKQDRANGLQYVTVSISTPLSMSEPTTYRDRLLIMRTEEITEAELIKQTVNLLVDQLRSAWQVEASRTWKELGR